MATKYGAMQFLSSLYRGIAVIVIFGGVGFGILGMVTPTFTVYPAYYSAYNGAFSPIRIEPGPPAVEEGVGILLGGLLAGVSLFAFVALVHLLIDMEENTWHTGRMLSRMVRTTNAINKLPGHDGLDEPSIEGLISNRRK